MDIQLVSLILGCIGTIGTIAGSVLTFVRSRVRISIDVVSWLQSDDCLFIYALITNNSRLPISVSSISAIMNGVDVPCSLEPFVVTYRKLPGILGKEQFEPVRSLPFPVNLEPLSGVSGYLYFRILNHPLNLFPRICLFQFIPIVRIEYQSNVNSLKTTF